MNVLSLFDGISCGRVALEKSGIPITNYFASEIDPNPMAVTEDNYPDTIQLGSIKNWRTWELPKIDIILAGSPCQGFSRQGNQLNFEHPQSKLFFDFVDVLKFINPSYYLLENVLMRTEWRHIIDEYMETEAIDINSRLLSAQNRPRLYWTNLPGAKVPKDQKIFLKSILERVEMDEFVMHQGIMFDQSFSENARNLVQNVDGEIRVSQTVKKGYIVAEDGDGINLSFPTSKSRRGRVIKGKSSTLDCGGNIGVYTDRAFRRFTITELERLQCLPDGYTKALSDHKRIQAIGNGWTIDVIKFLLDPLAEKLRSGIGVAARSENKIINIQSRKKEQTMANDELLTHIEKGLQHFGFTLSERDRMIISLSVMATAEKLNLKEAAND